MAIKYNAEEIPRPNSGRLNRGVTTATRGVKETTQLCSKSSFISLRSSFCLNRAMAGESTLKNTTKLPIKLSGMSRVYTEQIQPFQRLSSGIGVMEFFLKEMDISWFRGGLSPKPRDTFRPDAGDQPRRHHGKQLHSNWGNLLHL